MSASTAEKIDPTPQRIAKGDVQRPQIDRETNRPYHRAVDEFDRLYAAGSIDWHAKLAADKLKRHYMGSLGVNVATGEGIAPDEACEYPRTYHAQKLDQAQRAVTSRMWKGLVILLTEQGNVMHVGSSVCQRKQEGQARAAGVTLISEALEILSKLWGTK